MVFAGKNGLRRACALLCLALVLVFAGKSTVSVINHIQHHGEISAGHDHSTYGAFLSAPATHADGGQVDVTAEQDHPTAIGHHHHADGGSGALLALQSADFDCLWTDVLHASQLPSTLRSPLLCGPDQPPKPLSFQI